MELKSRWSQIEYYLQHGISLIPVYDKPTKVGSITFPAKKPCEDWLEYQTRIVDAEFLFTRMEYFNTTAVAIVCGKVSGNLEVIDIDVKWCPGIEAEIFKDIDKLFPALFKKLRIHRSPSGGFHIVYRILGTQPSGNKKIAGRERTQEEKDEWLQNSKTKKSPPNVWFVETRGEGGYVLAPPSLGYEVVRDYPIPVLTPDERECLISICKNYNQIVAPPKIQKPTQEETEYYEENPFLHFSRTADPISTLEDLEWKFVKQRGNYLWFTRPGKENGVSGSFNLETRCFYVFTSNSVLEESKGYFLANLVSAYKFDNDKKKSYKYFVDSGYGRIKPKIEEKIVKHKAVSYQTDLPPNLSKEAKESYNEFKKHLEELHPYGIFWSTNENNTISINREKLYKISADLGFRNYEEELWQIQDRIYLHRRSKREFFDTMKAYIQIEEDDMQEKVLNSYEKFIKDNGDFTLHRLKIITDEDILFDKKHISYKFYKDCWISITKDKVEKFSYNELDKLTFASKVQNREYKPYCKGKYIEFLNYAVELDKKYSYVKRVLGFLAHDYKDSTMGYIIILTEQCADPKQGGGSGKNVFCQLLNYTTTYVSKPGEQANLNEKFLQSWNGQRVLGLSDLPRDFNFGFLKEFVTGTSILKRLFKDERILPVEKLPKVICQTQFSYKISDGGLRRRMIPLEFTDFFTRMNGVDMFFGVNFPDGSNHYGWDEDDWAGYDWMITESIQEWLKCGLKLYAEPLSTTGWAKQFKQTYMDTIINIIEQYWQKWIEQQLVPQDEFKRDLEEFYEENTISPHYRPAMVKINQALAEYARYNGVYYEKDFIKTENGISKRFRVFKTLAKTMESDDEDPPF